MPHRARLVWRDLVTTAAPIAHNIDGYLAHQGHQTGDLISSGRVGRGITLSDGEGQEERAPTRRYLKPAFGCLRCNRRGCFVCILLRAGTII